VLDRSSSTRPIFRRSGADIILTYWAQQAAKWLGQQRGLLALSERIKCRSMGLTVTRWSRGVCHMGNGGLTPSAKPNSYQLPEERDGIHALGAHRTEG
jgi:hypothetical protein